ncbi:hypothetical protein MtrunA17_Chr1g0200681 [Medicago truncatula]|uniref:Transmembrane protein n=1 Tax=Medicago truncatula TaxID=3880 RepID=A0A396JTD1_MEDTR|nr:hypothetical protein MtrunA17_Chr1g0200681 [Medicago truncatula]
MFILFSSRLTLLNIQIVASILFSIIVLLFSIFTASFLFSNHHRYIQLSSLFYSPLSFGSPTPI